MKWLSSIQGHFLFTDIPVLDFWVMNWAKRCHCPDSLFLQLQSVLWDRASVRVGQQHTQSQEERRNHETLERVSDLIKSEMHNELLRERERQTFYDLSVVSKFITNHLIIIYDNLIVVFLQTVWSSTTNDSPPFMSCPAGSWLRPAVAAPRALIPSRSTTHTTGRTKEAGGTVATPSASPPSAPAVQTWRMWTPASCPIPRRDMREK